MIIRNLRWFVPLLLLVLLLVGPRLVTAKFAVGRILTPEAIDRAMPAIVFGAGLRRDGSPTKVLRERVATAADLFNQGKVNLLIMSGHPPEPEAMRVLAVEMGVPEQAVVVDNGGWRTYDSCYHGVRTFGLEEALLVTQAFHLPRALYLCDKLGLNVAGVAADRYDYRWPSAWIWNARETLATIAAMWDVHVSAPTPSIARMPAFNPEER